MLEAGKVVLADGRQVVAVQITEKHQREEKVREQEANHGRDFGQQEQREPVTEQNYKLIVFIGHHIKVVQWAGPSR